LCYAARHMNLFYMAHSGLRFLVLLAGAVNLLMCGIGLATKRPFDKASRITGVVFQGLLHLQVAVGLILAMTMTFYPQLIGHIVCMLGAAAVVPILFGRNKRAATPGFTLPLVGTVIALVLIVAGIMAIGRTPFGMVPPH
jgi:hypothetical protein